MRKHNKAVRSYERKVTPTIGEYTGFQTAFDFFNRELFNSALPDVLITYQRHAHSRGYFSADRFAGRTGEFTNHELALNPDHFVDRTDEQVVSTLCHEMCHLWQQECGEPSARGYHNKEFAATMKSIGLQPSSTGAPGGKETGQQITHYIIPGGDFQLTFQKLERTGWKLNLQSAHMPG
jgi:predicted SprT family Zn-dependent metalloprotease